MIERSAGNSSRGVVPCSSISCVSPFSALGITYMWSMPEPLHQLEPLLEAEVPDQVGQPAERADAPVERAVRGAVRDPDVEDEHVLVAHPRPAEGDPVHRPHVGVPRRVRVDLLRSAGGAARERDLEHVARVDGEPAAVRRMRLLIGENVLLRDHREAAEVVERPCERARREPGGRPAVGVEAVLPEALELAVEPPQLERLQLVAGETLEHGIGVAAPGRNRARGNSGWIEHNSVRRHGWIST